MGQSKEVDLLREQIATLQSSLAVEILKSKRLEEELHRAHAVIHYTEQLSKAPLYNGTGVK